MQPTNTFDIFSFFLYNNIIYRDNTTAFTSFAVFFLVLKSTCVNLLANPMWFPEMNVLNYSYVSNSV